MMTETQNFDAGHWVKTRSSLDSNQSTFLFWSGAIYAFVPGEKRNRLFKMVGMNVSRCLLLEEGSWDFTSRELTYYLHPETGEILRHWKNPWTGELLTVMHVANNPVQGHFKGGASHLCKLIDFRSAGILPASELSIMQMQKWDTLLGSSSIKPRVP